MNNNDINKKYDEVRVSLEKAIQESNGVELCGNEENKELDNVKNVLHQLDTDFQEEITRLQNSSEWDRFCMSFFGETNAGKSTIIEALRIVYDEEKRRKEMNLQDEEYYEELTKEEKQYSELINKVTQLNNSLTVGKKIKMKALIIVLSVFLSGSGIGFLLSYILL